jgi:hypothetical protein
VSGVNDKAARTKHGESEQAVQRNECWQCVGADRPDCEMGPGTNV